MIVREVVLAGDADDIRSVVALAVRRVPEGERAAWSSQVAGVANKRTRVQTASPGPRAGDAAPRPTGRWIALVAGVAASFAGATVLLPPRNEGNQDPALAMAVAVPAMVVGAAVLLALAFVTVPSAMRRNATALACAVIAAVAAIAGAVFALLRRDILMGAAGAPAYVLWWAAAAAVLVASVALAVRVISAPAGPTDRRADRPDDAARDVAVSADRAASRFAYGTDERRAWSAVMARDGASVDDAVRTQAERLGPFAYVAWAAYGGHVDARTVDELIRRG